MSGGINEVLTILLGDAPDIQKTKKELELSTSIDVIITNIIKSNSFLNRLLKIENAVGFVERLYSPSATQELVLKIENALTEEVFARPIRGLYLHTAIGFDKAFTIDKLASKFELWPSASIIIFSNRNQTAVLDLSPISLSVNIYIDRRIVLIDFTGRIDYRDYLWVSLEHRFRGYSAVSFTP